MTDTTTRTAERAAAALLAMLLCGCSSIALGERQVHVTWVDRVPDGLLLKRLELADSEPAELVRSVHFHGADRVPFSPPAGDPRDKWVGCWRGKPGEIHIARCRDTVRLWRHELHHARLAEHGDCDPMHQDESWERLGLLAPGDRHEVQP